MSKSYTLADIRIRNEFSKKDIEEVIKLHSEIYLREYDYGAGFEDHVIKGLNEFCDEYDPAKERVWICEDSGNLAGCLFLKNRNDSAQLRYFLIKPQYRGIGLGNLLMRSFLDFLVSCNYKSSYLWTTSELSNAAYLYIKYGFKLTEEISSENFGKYVTEQKYELIL